MSPEEALTLLRINPEEPLDDQLESLFFELKQKIYRQLDQVLLYSKWYKELTRLDTAARVLGFGFPEQKQESIIENTRVLDPNKNSMLAQFNAQYQLRSKMALRVYNEKAPLLLKELLTYWLEQQIDFFEFWAGAHLPTIDILLSQQFDPQQILGSLSELHRAEITTIADLTLINTPLQLQQYIAWNKAVWAKLNNA